MILSPMAFFLYFLAGGAFVVVIAFKGIVQLLTWSDDRRLARERALYQEHSKQREDAWRNRRADPNRWKQTDAAFRKRYPWFDYMGFDGRHG